MGNDLRRKQIRNTEKRTGHRQLQSPTRHIADCSRGSKQQWEHRPNGRDAYLELRTDVEWPMALPQYGGSRITQRDTDARDGFDQTARARSAAWDYAGWDHFGGVPDP